MSIDTAGSGTLLIILIMALVTLVTRWGGVFVMSFVPINHKVQQFIAAMSGSVLVAIIAPLFIQGDMGAKLALAMTAIFALTTKRPLIAIAFGIAMAAVTRQMDIY